MSGYDFGIFQQILTDFGNATSGWLAILSTLGVRIFWLIAVIDFGLVCVGSVVRRDVSHIVQDLTRVLIWLTVVYMILIDGGDLMRNGIIATLGFLGAKGGGVATTTLDPGSIMTGGFNIAADLLKAEGHAHWLLMPFDSVLVLVAAVAIIAMFASVAITVLELLIEIYIASIGGGFLLAISSSRFTYKAFEHWFNWCLGLGVRLMFTYLLLGIAEALITQFQNYVAVNYSSFTGNTYYSVVIVIEVWIWTRIVNTVPAHAAAAFGGSISASLGEAAFGAATQAGAQAAAQVPAAAKAGAQAVNNLGRTVHAMLLS
jgi:P-type conjugative transfer protein TrbL